jgi:phosphatidate cytidylyltransferase
VKQRIITGLIAGVLFLGLLYVGALPFTALIVALAIIGHSEFMKMNQIPITSMISLTSLITLIFLVFPWAKYTDFELSHEALIWFFMFIVFSATVITKNKYTMDHAAVAFLGTVYIGTGFQYMVSTRLEHGLFWTMFVFVLIWVSDSGAYFAGRAFGKHKLWPMISPNKTIEGAVGGVVLTVVAACLFAYFGHVDISYVRVSLIAVLIASSGMFGDLIQSAYKRVRNIKDSGALLPGHGGVLDRCDSWIIVFPLIGLLHLLP